MPAYYGWGDANTKKILGAKQVSGKKKHMTDIRPKRRRERAVKGGGTRGVIVPILRMGL